MTGGNLKHASVLIVSDDPDFARTVAARWQAERSVPEITLVTSDVWHSGSAEGYDLIILGPVRSEKNPEILATLNITPSFAAVCIASDEKDVARLRAEHPQVLVVPMQDGWISALILISCESLRRVEAVSRAQRAERMALECQGHATLGRYMLEMRPSVNNALTSMLGNADLLLLEPGQISPQCREQIHTIHAMGLRLNEIIQRFSSLAAEMRAIEKESHGETDAISRQSMASR
jgi:hypothetical protein